MGPMHNFFLKIQQYTQKVAASGISPLRLLEIIKTTGFTLTMEDYEKRKLSIFNQLNFFQLVTGIILPLAGLTHNHKLPALAWLVASVPAFISILVLWLNSRHYHHVALISYFVLYPVATSIVYLSGINLGVELSFVLYGILSVFFLQDISQMLFAVGLSMVSYFVLAVLCKIYTYELATANPAFYILNQLLSIAFIFYGLFLIKKENAGYQFSILQQKEEITGNEHLLKMQTEELTELNALKNKLFSVIAHDLKSPMYALRNLFQNMQQYDLPADEIKKMLPEVVNELTYTTSLMENLLQWARSQMQADSVKPQLIDISGLMAEVAKLLRLQAQAKMIKVVLSAEPASCAFADKDMINLVLRNLLSNAIKFTPEKGLISMGVSKTGKEVEVFVKDTGLGMSTEAIQKINLNNYYTSKGTSGESGTGLGLLLCKEFLTRNGGRLHIDSVPGKGSTFSFSLPGSE
ncbi:MAG TPA: HAMP domain-containing sensor histidine kinase [Puia sp.]|nr:HAMP domain-containing sensor histidine kinase [Puia sp.]